MLSSYIEGKHYISKTIDSYLPEDPIEIQTVSDSGLERSRQFEVRLTDPRSNPLNILEPDRVIVTIRDKHGMHKLRTRISYTG